MGLGFELVGQRLQLGRLAVAMRERLREQPVGEPGIPRQERAMEVRPEGASDAATLPTTLAVIAEPGHDSAERLRALVQTGSSRVVLEARQRPP